MLTARKSQQDIYKFMLFDVDSKKCLDVFYVRKHNNRTANQSHVTHEIATHPIRLTPRARLTNATDVMVT
jgi:hypothetical protein